MQITQERPVEQEDLLSVREVARRLAVSTRWVYRRVKTHELPHFRVGGVIRVSSSELQRWVAERRATP